MLHFPNSFPAPLMTAIEHDYASSTADILLKDPTLYDNFVKWANAKENNQWKSQHANFIDTINNCIYANQRICDLSKQCHSLPLKENAFALQLFSNNNPSCNLEPTMPERRNSHLDGTIDTLRLYDVKETLQLLQAAITSQDEADIYAITKLIEENTQFAKQVDEQLARSSKNHLKLIDECDPVFFHGILPLFQSLPATRNKLCEDECLQDLMYHSRYNLAHLLLEELPESFAELLEQNEEGHTWLHHYSSHNNLPGLAFVFDVLEKFNATNQCTQRSDEGSTFLHVTTQNQGVECLEFILKALKNFPEVLEELAVADDYGYTPLDHCALYDNMRTAQLLKREIPKIAAKPVFELWHDYYEHPDRLEESLRKMLKTIPRSDVSAYINDLCACPSLHTTLEKILKDNPQLQSSISLNFLSKRAEQIVYPLLTPSLIQQSINSVYQSTINDIDETTLEELEDIELAIDREASFTAFSSKLIEMVDDFFKGTGLLYIATLARISAFATLSNSDMKLEKLLPCIQRKAHFAALIPNLPVKAMLEFFVKQLNRGNTSLVKYLTLEQKKRLLNAQNLMLKPPIKEWQKTLEDLNERKAKDANDATLPLDIHNLLFEIEYYKNLKSLLFEAFTQNESSEELENQLKSLDILVDEADLIGQVCYRYFDDFDFHEKPPEIFTDNIITLDLIENPIAITGRHIKSRIWIDEKTWKNTDKDKRQHPITRETDIIVVRDYALRNRILRRKNKLRS